ncbi:hypothetical protein [Tardiphaga sp. P5_C7]
MKAEPSKVIKRRIVSVSAVTFAEITKIAKEAINAIKAGHSPDAVIRTRLAGGNETAVAVAVDRADALDRDLWTFRQLINAYTSQVTDGRTQELALRPSSIREIEDRLRDRPEAASLMDRYVKELRIDDLEMVRDEIKKAKGKSAHAKFVILAKRVLGWGHRHHRLRLGLEPTVGWWNYLSHTYKNGDRSGRKLTPAQVGMLMALIEEIRALEANTSDAVLGALQVCWMIVQRSTALVQMRALSSGRWMPDPAPDRAGWRVYTWSTKDVKNKREIRMSVPPDAIRIIERVERSTSEVLQANSSWAFPQTGDKYLIRAVAPQNGGVVPSDKDKPITSSALNHALDALAGRLPGAMDLLTMVGLPRKIGPHDLRRSVVAFFEGFGEGAFASALLDHKVSGIDKMSREVAAITQSVYSASDRVLFKSEGLDTWMQAVLPCYHAAKVDPRLKAAVAARKKELFEMRSKGGKADRKKRPAQAAIAT